MRLRPRHFVLLAIVIGLFVYNIVRHRHERAVVYAPPAPVVVRPRPTSAAWTAFDHAASLRDAADPDFLPAFQDLKQQIAAAPSQPGMEGCLTWLEFYRQSVLHPSRDESWKTRSQHHLDTCVQYHADINR